MQCACFDAGVDEFVGVLLEKEIKSRIDYPCYECGRMIRAGESHLFEKTVFDGRFKEYRTCVDCHSVREHLVESFYYGRVWETVYDCVLECGDHLPWVRFAKLTPLARARIFEHIESLWDLV